MVFGIMRRAVVAGLVGVPAATAVSGTATFDAVPAPHPRMAADALAEASRWLAPRPVPGWAEAEWGAFRERFVAPGGWVVDTGNGGVSHSEGQGWGLLFAERFGDRETFDRLLGWTRAALQRPHDALHAWRFRHGVPVPVDDLNNATDGDLFIAWALLRAARRWAEPGYEAAGRAVAASILRAAVRQEGERLLLLPGARGFVEAGQVVVNPSYYALPALRGLAAALPDPAWTRLEEDGLALLRAARFGRWGLPPDWAAVPFQTAAAGGPGRGAPPRLATGRRPRFSWDAVRLPLYLAWAGLAEEPAAAAAARFWSSGEHGGSGLPAWVDLTNGAVSPEAAGPGIAAIAQLVLAARAGGGPVEMPSVATAPDYYAAALTLLARLAWEDSRPTWAGA